MKIENPSNSSGQRVVPDVQLNEFTKEDRERVMEILLSQERVISILYDKVTIH